MKTVQGSRKREHLYPIYLVHEKEIGKEAEESAPFLIADVQFRGKKTRLQPTAHQIRFNAYTEIDELVVRVEYEHVDSRGGDHGDVLLFFDRGSTRRKRHNMFTLRIKSGGRVVYEEHNYELETVELPPAIRYQLGTSAGMDWAEFRIMLSYLRINAAEDRVVGFNAARILQDPADNNNLSGDFISWSGIPGDRPSGGVGNGDLLLTRGLGEGEITEWAEKVQTYGSTHFLQWERRFIPEEIHGLMAEKSRGYTGRLNASDVKRARHNAESTEWGRLMKRDILDVADYWAAKSDEELFEFVPVGNPRALSVGQFFGNPLYGGKRTAFEVCLERPYEYYSIHTKTWWHVGMTLEHPETGEEIVLEDDSGGFVAPEGFPVPGARYMFTAAYRLFLISMLLGRPYCTVMEDKSVCPETSGERYASAIPNLAFAYQLTQDKKYAYKALLLAGRLAELIPYMNGNYGSGYYDTVQIAEPTTTECHWLSAYFDALDLLFDVIGEVEGDLKAFFADKPDAEGGARQRPFCVKTAVNDMIPFVLYSCEIERTRNTDWSLRYIYLELLIASYMGSGKLMHRVLNEGPHCLKGKVRNNFFRDGRYIYDSLGYLVQICDQVTMMANNNYGFRDEEYFPDGIDMFEQQEYGISQVIRYYSRLYCGGLTPMFGDTNADNREPVSEERRKGKFKYSPAFEISYARMKSLRGVLGPILAQYDSAELHSYRLQSNINTNVKHSMLLLALTADWEEYQTYKQNGAAIQPSFLVEDSETSVLRAGTDAHNCKHLVLYGQPSAGHKHGDKLGLWIGAYGYHLMAGVGGYPFTWLSPKFDQWEIHSAACTVTLVDGKHQAPSYSEQRCHYEGELLQVTGMVNTTAYPGTAYERWCWLVQAPDRENAYVVDLSYLSGGGTFDYNTMGLDASPEQIEFQGVSEEDWLPMQGTLAGEDVELYSQPGYGWMKAQRYVRTDSPISWTYRYAGAGMKVHTLPDPESAREVICSLGERGGEEMGKSRWEPFVLWRDKVADPAAATGHKAVFATVLEPFERESEEERRYIASVRPMVCKTLEAAAGVQDHTAAELQRPVGIELRYEDGVHKDILIAVHEGCGPTVFVDSDGVEYSSDAKSLLLRYRDGLLVDMEAVGFTTISDNVHTRNRKAAACIGHITSVNVEDREVQVELTEGAHNWSAEALKGQVALIDAPEYGKPSTYYLHDARLDGAQLTFRSDMSLIKLDADWKSPQKRLGMGAKQAVLHEGKQVLVDIKPGDSFHLWNAVRETFSH